MTRHFKGLGHTGAASEQDIPAGVYLVRVEKAQYRWHAKKPLYLLRLAVLEPRRQHGQMISGRIICSCKTLWKLGWFLRDFGYDPELLRRDEVDERAMAELIGVVKISHAVVRGAISINFDGFAPANQWPEFCTAAICATLSNEVAL